MDKTEEYRRQLQRAEWQAEVAVGESERQAWLTIAESYRVLLGYPPAARSRPQTEKTPFGNDNEPQ